MGTGTSKASSGGGSRSAEYIESSATGRSPVTAMREQANMYKSLASDVHPKAEAEAVGRFTPNITSGQKKAIEAEFKGQKQVYKDLASKREKIISDMISVRSDYEKRKGQKIFAYVPSINKQAAAKKKK